MRVLENVEPREVFRFFEDLTQIPRPSHHEKAVSDYLVSFAKERGLEVYQDALYNVIIIKEASRGYEDAEPLILQGHMDMVCEKDPGIEKDMEKEGLDLEVSDDFVRARGTTLGADDGIAAAMALALLDSDTIGHPRLEFICTVCEEVGMDGASAIDLSPIRGHVLLNLDSESEGSVLAGCAGGAMADVNLPVKREPCGWTRIGVKIEGLKGGHSGDAIDKGRASSVSLMGRVLRGLMEVTEVRLISAEHGSKDNAISREGKLLLAVRDKAAAERKLSEMERNVRAAYSIADPDIRFTTAEPQEAAGETAGEPLTEESTRAVTRLVSALPQGVLRMSDHRKGLVETSLNWGIATLDADQFRMGAAVRSAVNTEKEALLLRLRWIAETCGASMEVRGVYPAWEWVEHSKLRDRMARIYRELFGRELKVEEIHGGVECGLLSGKIPHMDAVSMGPDIFDIHTPREHLSISSVQRTWEFVKKIVEDKS